MTRARPVGSVCGCRQQVSDQHHMGTAFKPAKTSPASWGAFHDVDAFVDAVLVELASMAGTKPTRRGPKPPLAGAALRKASPAARGGFFWRLQWRGRWAAGGHPPRPPFHPG